MSDVMIGGSVEVTNCAEDCPCQVVHIILLDDDDEPIATASGSPEVIRGLARELLARADRAEAAQLRLAGRIA